MARTVFLTLLSLAFASCAAPAPEIPQQRALQHEVERTRRLKFAGLVRIRHQTRSEQRASLEEQVRTVYPTRESIRREQRMLEAVGLLPRGFDLEREVRLTSEVAGFYDPHKELLLIRDPSRRKVMLHEMAHALQNQEFDLARHLGRFERPEFNNRDEELAFRCLMEGEASLITSLLTVGWRNWGSSACPPHRPALVHTTLTAPYSLGQWFVWSIWQEHGWEAVNALWRDPPRSTAQIIDPKKALPGSRDDPTLLELPDVSRTLGEGLSLQREETLGVLGLRALFRELEARPYFRWAIWEGDRLQSYDAPGRAWPVIIWLLTFDDRHQAKRFSSALKWKRHRGPPPLAEALVQVRGKDVLIVGGVEAAKAARVARAVLAGVKRKE